MIELFTQPYFFIPLILMFVCLIGLLICCKKQFHIKYIHQISILILIILFINSGYIFYKTFFYSATEIIIQNELKYKKAAGIVLGKYIAKHYAGKKVLIIANYKNNKYEKMLTDALMKGFDNKLQSVITDYPKIKPPVEILNQPTPINIIDIVTTFNIKEVVDKYKDYEVVVLLFGLPLEFDNVNILLEGNNKKWFFMFTDIHYIANLIYEKKIAGCIIFKPLKNYNQEEDVPKDINKAFNKRFLLITPDNIMKIHQKYPDLFK